MKTELDINIYIILVILLNLNKDVFIDKNNKDQVTELKDIKWVTKNEALSI